MWHLRYATSYQENITVRFTILFLIFDTLNFIPYTYDIYRRNKRHAVERIAGPAGKSSGTRPA